MTDRLPNNLDGIVWTAIRDMMGDYKEVYGSAEEYTEWVRRIANHMSDEQRKHEAWDIRQNVEWIERIYKREGKQFSTAQVWLLLASTAQVWLLLADWLDSGARYDITEPLPGNGVKVSDIWYGFIFHCLRYILHRKSYATGYSDDVARLYNDIPGGFRGTLAAWLKANIREDDDDCCRKLAAAFDMDNRYLVTAKATIKQLKEYHNMHDVKVIGDVVPIPLTTYHCFKFEDDFVSLDNYIRNPSITGWLIKDFIVKVEKI